MLQAHLLTKLTGRMLPRPVVAHTQECLAKQVVVHRARRFCSSGQPGSSASIIVTSVWPKVSAKWLGPCGAAVAAIAHHNLLKVQCEDDCHTHRQVGDWRQDSTRSESLAPFLCGLGVPRFAVVFVDAIRTDLSISCENGELTVVDQTLFGKNTTQVILGGEEVERATKGGRKKFMLSGYKDAEGRLTVQCRLFQRGDGWFTRQSWIVLENGDLEDRMELQRPGHPNVVVTRVFEPLGKGSISSAALAGGPGSSVSQKRPALLGSAALISGTIALALFGVCGFSWVRKDSI